MIIDCISDLHGHYPKLEGGDLLIVAGDLTAKHTIKEMFNFVGWLQFYKNIYKKIIIIAGNHDPVLEKDPNFFKQFQDDKICYLFDSGTEFEGLKIWGSPWTLAFEGMNPRCKAFTCETEEELAEKWELIPDDVDILVTHSPAQGVLDEVEDYISGEIHNCGSSSLIKPMVKSGCRFHIYGHIHEGYGIFKNNINGITCVNASHCDENYKPVNKPIRIEI